MATDRQIAANRRNAARSTGPKSDEGKARSRANATKHGLAGESAAVEAGFSDEFADRRAQWAASRPPVDDAAEWALDRAVAASLRIERCERAVEDLCEAERERAGHAWDQDRAVEAATIFGRLAKEPTLASCQLQASLAGVDLLVEAWLVLVAALESGEDWSEAECSKALDLLGVAADHRSGRTPVDYPEGADQVASRRALALEEVDRLEALRDEALVPLDEMERRHAMAGDVALLSRPAKLLLRYERDAWRRYRESIREVQAPPSAPPATIVARSPVVAAPPRPRERPVAPEGPSFEEQRRALRAEMEPYRSQIDERIAQMARDEDPDWLEDLERRFEAPTPARPSATERTRFEVPVGQGS